MFNKFTIINRLNNLSMLLPIIIVYTLLVVVFFIYCCRTATKTQEEATKLHQENDLYERSN